MRVLVVEDEADIASAVAARLRSEGFDVDVASDGPAGVDLARHNLTRTASVAVDPDYLGHLSDDAVPTIVGLLPNLDPVTRDAVVAAIGCPAPDPGADSWPAWNLGTRRAADARRDLCRG